MTRRRPHANSVWPTRRDLSGAYVKPLGDRVQLWVPERPGAEDGERAEFILWGKFFAADALGPRCYNHAAAHLGDMSAHNIEQTAVYDLRRVYRLRDDYRTLWGMTFGPHGQPPTDGTPDDIERLRALLTDLNGENQQ